AIFGLVRATVESIADQIVIVVRFGAAVCVLESVVVLRLVRTCVVLVEDAIAVEIAAVVPSETKAGHRAPIGRAETFVQAGAAADEREQRRALERVGDRAGELECI